MNHKSYDPISCMLVNHGNFRWEMTHSSCFQNGEIFVQLDELDELDKITLA